LKLARSGHAGPPPQQIASHLGLPLLVQLPRLRRWLLSRGPPPLYDEAASRHQYSWVCVKLGVVHKDGADGGRGDLSNADIFKCLKMRIFWKKKL